ncbi:hypothetical protein ABZ656_32790 [Streptomyces sp. NPDC007095]|uniref:hypothetical protein n=1 Tax=Streptomyces sp. NPDC007095 TaxID=3154482 RepID=UPI000C705D20
MLSSFSWKEGLEGGKLLARVGQPFRYAGDIDMKMLKAILERLERGRGLLIANAVSYDSVSALRTAFEDMQALLLSSLQRAEVRMPHKPELAFNQVVNQLHLSSVPNPAAIAALVPLAMPFHPRLRTRVVMALKNAGELLRKAGAGELDIRGWPGLRTPTPPLQRTARVAS